MPSTTMKSRDGRRVVSFWPSASSFGPRGYKMNYTRSTKYRTDEREGFARTKADAVAKAREFLTK